MSKDAKVRKYMIKSFSKNEGEPTDLDTNSGMTTASEGESVAKVYRQKRPIKVVDRFGIILQIFAQRAKSRESIIQLELAWLNYAKHRLVRDRETNTMISIGQFARYNAMLYPQISRMI